MNKNFISGIIAGALFSFILVFSCAKINAQTLLDDSKSILLSDGTKVTLGELKNYLSTGNNASGNSSTGSTGNGCNGMLNFKKKYSTVTGAQSEKLDSEVFGNTSRSYYIFGTIETEFDSKCRVIRTEQFGTNLSKTTYHYED